MGETQLPGRRSGPARSAGLRWFSGVALAALGGWLLLASGASPGEPREGDAMAAFELTSPSFAAMEEIPRRHSCERDDVSPELRWTGVPEGTRSSAI
jgi:hypothetical protein